MQAFPGFWDIGNLVSLVELSILGGCFIYRYLNNSIQFIFKDAVGFFNLTQRETMGNKWSGVNLAFLNKAENFLAIASIYATRFEGQIFAVHVWQRKNLGLVVKSNYGNDGIRTGALPCKAEGIIGSGHFKHTVSTAMVAMLQYKLLALFGSGKQHFGVVLAYEVTAFLGLLAHDDASGIV